MLIRLVTLVLPPPDLRRVASYVRQQVSTGSISDESMRPVDDNYLVRLSTSTGLVREAGLS
jgi:hypothetical protein